MSFHPRKVDPTNKFYYVTMNFHLESKLEEIWQSNKYSFDMHASSGANILLSSRNRLINKKDTTVSSKIVYQRFYKGYLDKEGTLLLDVFASIKFNGTISKKDNVHDHILIRENALAKFGGLLKDPLFTDFTFNVKGREFKVHRNILASYSQVFKKIFETNIEPT